MAQLIGCPCVLVPEAGHISSLENPEFVTEVLGFWLSVIENDRSLRQLLQKTRSHVGAAAGCDL
jgi:hypothetical protein